MTRSNPRLADRLRFRAAALALTLTLGGCAGQPQQGTQADDDGDDDDAPAAVAPSGQRGTPAPSPDLPKQELTGEMVYEFLLAEIAGQRGNVMLSAQAYSDLAKRTRDPRVAERATEIALHARNPEAAVEAAKVWAEAAPDSTKALGTAASLLVNVNRVDEAEPYLKRILAVSEQNRGEGFMQLNRLLANNPDKGLTLRVIRELAEP
jgi:hypothetical protein